MFSIERDFIKSVIYMACCFKTDTLFTLKKKDFFCLFIFTSTLFTLVTIDQQNGFSSPKESEKKVKTNVPSITQWNTVSA